LDEKINGTVFITGASGFLASYVITELLDNNYRVYATDVREHELSIVSHQADNFFFIKKEFSKAKKDIEELFQDNKKTVFSTFHFAGISDANTCEKNPLSAYDANVNLTVEVLDFCKKQNIPKFYFSSTALVYGENTINQSSSEESLINPLNFYAWTKFIAEKTVKSYCASFGLQATVMRFNSIIGYPLKTSTILNDVFSQINNGDEEVVIQNGNPVRDYIFVKDAVSALICLLNKDSDSNFEIYNVSNGKGVSAMELARLVCTVNDLPASSVKSKVPTDSYPPVLVLDNTKLKQTGWSSLYSIEKSLREINKMMIK